MKKLLLLALLAPAAACASTRAQTPPEDAPVLEVPPVPPRHIQPLPVDPPPIELVANLPTENTAPNPARPRPPQRDSPNANSKTGTPPDPKVEAKTPETPPDPAQTATPPVPPLRTPGDPEGPEMARQIRDTLERANRMLDKVHYPSLNGERQANYDNARSFIKQAEEAVKKNDLITAKSLADRAETIAKALAGG